MTVGYFYNGHISDKLSNAAKDSPCGNAWYSSSIIEECLKRKNDVFLLGPDKDITEWAKFGNSIFDSFESKRRDFAFSTVKRVKWLINNDLSCYLEDLPKLDVILLEWRFPIKGRNTIEDINSPNFQYDLLMQEYILKMYDCPIIIFDLDYKMTIEDEQFLSTKKNVVIFETSNKPEKRIIERVQVEIPFWMNNTKIIENTEVSKYKDVVYIGSRYERDRSIQDYLVYYSDKELFKVWFYGNWRKYKDKYDELYIDMNWRNIQYHDRVGHEHFKEIYSDSVCCPLLAKDEYYKKGFMTARIQECLYFGSIPIGFKEHYMIEKYLPENLIATDSVDFYNKVQQVKKLSLKERNKLRKDLWKNLSFMDVSNFVNTMEKYI